MAGDRREAGDRRAPGDRREARDRREAGDRREALGMEPLNPTIRLARRSPGPRAASPRLCADSSCRLPRLTRAVATIGMLAASTAMIAPATMKGKGTETPLSVTISLIIIRPMFLLI